jgi:HK97 family phage major capsid protein
MAELELKDQVADIAKTFTALRGEVEALKSRDVVDETKFTKMSDHVTAQLEALQAKQALLEAAASRMDQGQEAKGLGKKEFDAFLRKGVGLDGVARAGQSELEVRAMRTDSGAEGGYLVRPEFANFVVDRVFETSPVRRLARVITIGGKSLTVDIDDNEADASWGSEGSFVSETNTPAVGQRDLVTQVLQAYPRATMEMLEDGVFDVEAWLQAKVADVISRRENTAFVTGTGVSRPRGFTTYPAWASAGVYERDKIERINSTAATTVAVDGLILTQNALKEDYQAGASWAMKRTTFGAVLRLKSTDNYNFLGLSVAPGNQNIEMRILQKPVTFMDDMAATGAGNIVAAYADWRRFYTIVDRIGLQIIRDPFTSPGNVKYIVRKRVAGDVTSFDAGKLMVCAA